MQVRYTVQKQKNLAYTTLRPDIVYGSKYSGLWYKPETKGGFRPEGEKPREQAKKYKAKQTGVQSQAAWVETESTVTKICPDREIGSASAYIGWKPAIVLN